MTSGVALSSQRLVFDGSGPLELDVAVANVSDVIDTFELRVLGLDAEWLEGNTEPIQLFPGESGNFSLSIDLPDDFPAGRHDVVVQVRSSIFPERLHISRIDLVVDGYEQIALDLSPNRVIGGGRSDFVVTALNQGNKESWVELELDDPEGLTEVEFNPSGARVQPGRQQLFSVRLKAPRPWFGQPASRILNVGVKGVDDSITQLFNFVQKPKIGRWILSMCGLLFAVLVFGLVLSRELSTFADRVGVDKSVLQDAYASSSGTGNQGNATLEGKVLDSRSLQPVPWAQVQVYDGADPANKVRSTATDETGSFIVGGLNRSGSYRVSFEKPGYLASWYGGGKSIDVAQLVYPSPLGLQAQLQGQLSLVEGVVVGPTGAASTASLLIDPQVLRLRQVNDPAVMASVIVGGDGKYQFEEIPSGRYQVRISVPGFSTQYSDFFHVGAGSSFRVPEIAVQKGNGEISGNLRIIKEGVGVPLEYAEIRLDDVEGMQRYSLTEGTPTIRFQVATGENGLARLASDEQGVITLRKLDFSEGDPELQCRIPSGAKGCEISAGHVSETSSVTLPVADEMNLKVSVATLLGSPLNSSDIQVIDGAGREFFCSEDGNTRNDIVPSGGSTFDTSINGACGFGGVAPGKAQVFVYRPNEGKSALSAEISSGRQTHLEIGLTALEVAEARLEIIRYSSGKTVSETTVKTSTVLVGAHLEEQILQRPVFGGSRTAQLQIEDLDWSDQRLDGESVLVYGRTTNEYLCEITRDNSECRIDLDTTSSPLNPVVVQAKESKLIITYGRPDDKQGVLSLGMAPQSKLGTLDSSTDDNNKTAQDDGIDLSDLKSQEDGAALSIQLVATDGVAIVVPDNNAAKVTVVGSNREGLLTRVRCSIPSGSDSCSVSREEIGYGLLNIGISGVAGWEPLLSEAFVAGSNNQIDLSPNQKAQERGPGDFRFSNLPTPASYFLTVVGSELIQEHTMEIQLVEGQVLQDLIVLAEPSFGSIRGQLSMPPGVSGRAGGIQVVASDGENSWSSTSISVGSSERPVGSFVFPKLPVPGTYQITVEDPLMDASAIDYVVTELAPDVVAPNPLLLKPKEGSLSGRVFQCQNTSCSLKVARPKADVKLSNSLVNLTTMSVDRCFAELGTPNAAVSGCGGDFEVDGVPVGSYLLAVEVTGAQPQTRQVTIGSGTTTTVEVLVPVSAELEIEICNSLPTSSTARCGVSDRMSGWNVALYKEAEFPTGAPVPGVSNANGDITTYTALDAPVRYVVTANGPSTAGKSGNLSTSFAMPASSKVVLVCTPPVLTSNLASCRLVNLG